MENTTAMTSATTTDHQMPSSFQIMGSRITAPNWNTRVRRKEIIAEVTPSFSAVKKPEAKMAYPIKGNDTAKIVNP